MWSREFLRGEMLENNKRVYYAIGENVEQVRKGNMQGNPVIVTGISLFQSPSFYLPSEHLLTV